MATALFIKRQDLVKNTALSGNVDTDKFIQFIKLAQEIHVRNYLGTDLYDKISSDIIADTLTGDYLNLVNDYIQPMLIHFAMSEYLPFAAYSVANGGVFKHTSENSQLPEKEEIEGILCKNLLDPISKLTSLRLIRLSINVPIKLSFPSTRTSLSLR